MSPRTGLDVLDNRNTLSLLDIRISATQSPAVNQVAIGSVAHPSKCLFIYCHDWVSPLRGKDYII